MSNQPDTTANLSEAIAVLTKTWGKPEAVRGGAQTLTAVFKGLKGPITDIFANAGTEIDFFSMAPQRIGEPPDMAIVTGRAGDGVAFLAKVCPSAREGLHDVDMRLDLRTQGPQDGGVPLAIFETLEQLLGDRLYEEGVYAQFMAHLLRHAGRHRERFYSELAQLVADYVRAPDEAP